MKKYFLLTLMMPIFNLLNAQQAVSASAGEAKGVGGIASFTIGQIDYINLTTIINSGVQQISNTPTLHTLNTYQSFSGFRLASKSYLKWQSTTNASDSIFKIERLVNENIGFIDIGLKKINASENNANYKFVDDLPKKGFDYYRLKKISKKGNFLYSKTIPLFFEEIITASCYPNPTNANIYININAKYFSNYTYSIYTNDGKLLSKSSIEGPITKIPMQQLPCSIYQIKLMNNGIEITSFSILKY